MCGSESSKCAGHINEPVRVGNLDGTPAALNEQNEYRIADLWPVPHFIDIHELPGVTSEIAAAEHVRDTEIQGPYKVDFSKYWLNEETGKLFCYCEAPTAEVALEVHRLAHGDPSPENIIEVTPDLVELFLGSVGFVDKSGAVLIPGTGGTVHDRPYARSSSPTSLTRRA
jgi:hypothetical protein